MSGGTEEALREFIEAVNEDVGGLWIDHDEGEGDETVFVSLLGHEDLHAIAEAYVVACNELGKPIVAKLSNSQKVLTPKEAARLCDLPRMK